MPLVLLGSRARRARAWAAAGALLVCWLQPWQGADARADRARRGACWRRRRRAQDRDRRRGAASPSRRLLLPARPARPGLGARREVERRGRAAGVELAVVGDRADRRAARDPRRARLPPGRPQLAGEGRAGVAVRRARGLPAPVGTFPYHSFQGLAIPLSILAVQGVLTVWRHPRPLVVAGLLRADDRARASRTSSRSRSTRSAAPATRSGCSPARSTR